MALTYTDQYANLGPTPEAAAYFNDLPDAIKSQIIASGRAPNSLKDLKKLVEQADYMV